MLLNLRDSRDILAWSRMGTKMTLLNRIEHWQQKAARIMPPENTAILPARGGLPGPAFFPEGFGLQNPSSENWPTVMAIGHNFGCNDYRNEIDAAGREDDKATWRRRGDQLLKMVERLIKGRPLTLDDDTAAQIQSEVRDAQEFIIGSLPEEFAQAGRWEVECYVLPYVRERIPTMGSISEALRECQVALRGWYFPHFDRENTSNFGRGVQSHTAARGTFGKHLEGYRAFQSGVFVWKSEYWEDTSGRVPIGQKVLSFVGVILEITEFFLFAKRYYAKTAPDSTVHLTVRLTDTQNRVLASFGEGSLHGNYVCRESQVEADIECTAAELAASYDELARKAIRRVYELFNWNDSREELISQWQEKLVNRSI